MSPAIQRLDDITVFLLGAYLIDDCNTHTYLLTFLIMSIRCLFALLI